MSNAELKNEIIRSLENGVGEHRFNRPYEFLIDPAGPTLSMVIGLSVQPVEKTPLQRNIPRKTHIPFRSGFTGYLQSLLGDSTWNVGSFFHEGRMSILVYKENTKYLVELILARRYTFFPAASDCTPDDPSKLLSREEVEKLFAKLREEHCDIDVWETLIAVAKAHGWYTVRKIGQQLLFLAYPA